MGDERKDIKEEKRVKVGREKGEMDFGELIKRNKDLEKGKIKR